MRGARLLVCTVLDRQSAAAFATIVKIVTLVIGRMVVISSVRIEKFFAAGLPKPSESLAGRGKTVVARMPDGSF